jgi:hypothetical protein
MPGHGNDLGHAWNLGHEHRLDEAAQRVLLTRAAGATTSKTEEHGTIVLDALQLDVAAVGVEDWSYMLVEDLCYGLEIQCFFRILVTH